MEQTITTMANKRKDKFAVVACKSYLEEIGYEDVQIIHTPTDLKAMKDGVQHYIDVKMTSRQDKYFGAATITEWGCVGILEFLVAQSQDGTNNENTKYNFFKFSAEEFASFSTIPPFKVYFTVPLTRSGEIKLKKSKESKALCFDYSLAKPMKLLFEALKDPNKRDRILDALSKIE